MRSTLLRTTIQSNAEVFTLRNFYQYIKTTQSHCKQILPATHPKIYNRGTLHIGTMFQWETSQEWRVWGRHGMEHVIVQLNTAVFLRLQNVHLINGTMDNLCTHSLLTCNYSIFVQ